MFNFKTPMSNFLKKLVFLFSLLLCYQIQAQETFVGPFIQIHISSPSNLDSDNFTAEEYLNSNYNTSVEYQSSPGFSIGASVQHTISKKLSFYVIPAYTLINLKMTNNIFRIDNQKINDLTSIEKQYKLSYISTSLMMAYANNGWNKNTLLLKSGIAFHFLANEDYSSAPFSKSRSKFSNFYASFLVEIGSRFILKNEKPLDLTFVVDADFTGFEGGNINEARPNPKPANIFTAGMRIHYFLFN